MNFLCLQMILSHLLPALDRLLERVFKKPEAMLKDEVVLLHLILGKFNECSAALLCKNQQSLDLFIKSLHAAKKIYEEIPPFQITALGQVQLYERSFMLKANSSAYDWIYKVSFYVKESIASDLSFSFQGLHTVFENFS